MNVKAEVEKDVASYHVATHPDVARCQRIVEEFRALQKLLRGDALRDVINALEEAPWLTTSVALGRAIADRDEAEIGRIIINLLDRRALSAEVCDV